MTAGRIGKPPPPTPPMERCTGLPEGLRLALQALTDSERDWERPPGSEPIYWVQVGNRMFHRNDIMRQAIMLEQQPEAEIPQLQLTLVEGRADNGTPCYIATAVAEGGSSGSGTISSTLPTITTDWSTHRPVEATIGKKEVDRHRLQWHRALHHLRACSRRQSVPMEC